jgi:hypothetical protein
MDVSVAVDAESFGCCVRCLTLFVNGKQSCGGGDMMDQSTNVASKKVERRKRSNWRPAARNENSWLSAGWSVSICEEGMLSSWKSQKIQLSDQKKGADDNDDAEIAPEG